MTSEEALQLLNTAMAAATQLSTLLPQLQANWADVEAAWAATSDADLQPKIDQAHADIVALGAQLDVLKA